jgi:prophage antirepressor-like protein
MQLTNFGPVGYADSAVPQWAAGVASPVRSGRKPHLALSAAFFMSRIPVMGVRSEGADRLAGAPPVLQTSDRSPTRSASGLADYYRNWSKAMFVHSEGASAPSVFSFDTSHIRVFTDEQGESWFCAHDVCSVLGYVNPRDAIAKHCREKGVAKRDTLTGGGAQSLIYINEPNLYRLIIKSRKPEAERFEAWVMEEVLPALRKTGSYTTKQEPLGAFIFMNGTVCLAGHRYLVSFSDDGKTYRAKPVPSDCVVMTPRQFFNAIVEPNGVYASTDDLFDFIANAQEKLKARMRGHESIRNALTYSQG